jgi:hypothetical protein
MLRVSRTKLAGKKYREATKYNLDSAGSTIPKVVSKDGKK